MLPTDRRCAVSLTRHTDPSFGSWPRDSAVDALKQRRTHTSMPQHGFQSMISAIELSKTECALASSYMVGHCVKLRPKYWYCHVNMLPYIHKYFYLLWSAITRTSWNFRALYESIPLLLSFLRLRWLPYWYIDLRQSKINIRILNLASRKVG